MFKEIKSRAENINLYTLTIFTKGLYCTLMFIANALITRFLGTELKGEYTWLITTANIISIFAGLGIYQSISFCSRKNDTNIVQTYSNIFCLQAFVYGAIILSLYLAIGDSRFILILVLALADLTSQQFSMLILITNPKIRNFILIVGAILNLLLNFIALYYTTASVLTAIGIMVIIKIIYIILFIKKLNVNPHIFQINVESIFSKIKFGFVPMLSFLLITLNYKVDILMLKGFSVIEPSELSFYATGVSVAEVAWLIPDVFKEVLFSKTAKDNAYEDVIASLRVSNFVLFIFIVAMTIGGKAFLKILYGSAFLQAYPVTLLILCGIPAMSWFKIINTLFVAQGKSKIGFIILLCSMVLNIVINLWMIPRMGIAGAAIASVSSYCLCGFIFLISFARQVNVSLRQLIIPKKNDFITILRRK